jgi:hypothetical protein
MEKYVGAFGANFILIKDGLQTKIGDIVAPSINNLVKCLVESVDGINITLSLINKDTFMPLDYLDGEFDWEVISTTLS